uniref:Peptidase M24 domain-containing protein n=1 Tax=Aegilops tauschii subsp. strangulata TaxID=200361 RepID=A0A452YWS2_AEGTS
PDSPPQAPHPPSGLNDVVRRGGQGGEGARPLLQRGRHQVQDRRRDHQQTEALKLVLSECKPKAKIVDICEKGDNFITEQTGNVYKNVKRKIERGIAFPTCVSVNNTVCHFSPLATDDSVLEENDMVKIDMACHIDGFIAVVAHTHVIKGGPVTGRAANVLAAANTAAEVAMRLVRPGKKNKD